ncbi:MAG: excinuclease ABC subunit C [Deltaproteobacteria bacterium HGW-Deltaproteobacteria-22]|nr:MAG: excinuclease ABC subunit C [Deltaproteobacteria bacterium HGW-Deltaproteobacteria-22]
MDLRDPAFREPFLSSLPHSPGVYVMRNAAGQVLYVGKALDLFSRVNSYFRASGDTRSFVSRLPSEMADLEIWVTQSEREALLLENTLIKELKPRYNVRLRDDRSYLMIRVQAAHPWPRFETARGLPQEDGARYFGPYHAASAVHFFLSFIGRYFRFRTCSDAVFATRRKPCLQYHMGRCEAPCSRNVDAAAYRRRVEKAMLYLEGRFERLMRDVRREMKQASADLEFEKAAQLRDLLFALEKCAQPQQVITSDFVPTDAVGFVREGPHLSLVVLEIRQGQLGVHRQMVVEVPEELYDAEILSTFLFQHYASRTETPGRLLLPFAPEAAADLAAWLGEAAGAPVEVVTTVVDEAHVRLLRLAEVNAQHRLTLHNELEVEADLARLSTRLHLPGVPKRIECYDISHSQGKDTSASMVVFIDGRPAPRLYRQFHVRDVAPGDDYGALREVMARRLEHVAEKNWELPDLMVIDGGRGQLRAITQILSDLQSQIGSDLQSQIGSGEKNGLDLSGVKVISLAKQHGSDGPPERVFLPGVKEPLPILPGSREMFILVRLRDEAHRFANRARTRRQEKTFSSRLSEVPGLGPKRVTTLLTAFGSVERIRTADPAEIAKAGHFSLDLAQKILAFLNA